MALVSLALYTSGCAQKQPARVTPADFSKVQTQHASAQAGLTEARAHTQRAKEAIASGRAAVGRARTGVTLQREAVERLKPAIATLAQNVPPELRPEVEALGVQVKIVEARLEDIAKATTDADKAGETATLEATLAQQAASRAEQAVGLANIALDEARKKDAEKTAIANANADLAESEKTDKLKAQKNAVIAWSVAGVAVLGCAVLAYLLFKP